MLYVNPLTSPDALRGGGTAEEPARQRLALQEMEHLFLFTLLQEMRKSVPDDPLLGSSVQRSTFDEMLDDALSAEMARSGQFGLARQMEEQMQASNNQGPVDGEAKDLRGLLDAGLAFKSFPRIADTYTEK